MSSISGNKKATQFCGVMKHLKGKRVSTKNYASSPVLRFSAAERLPGARWPSMYCCSRQLIERLHTHCSMSLDNAVGSLFNVERLLYNVHVASLSAARRETVGWLSINLNGQSSMHCCLLSHNHITGSTQKQKIFLSELDYSRWRCWLGDRWEDRRRAPVWQVQFPSL